MTSEIRANTLKNRVGLGTVSFTNTGPVVSGIVTATSIEVVGAINDDAARIKIPDGMNGSPYTGNLELGNSRDFVMLHDGHHNYVKCTQNMYVFCGGNNLVTLQTGGSVLLNRDLDVDGHTNLDNVNITGITTMTGDLDVDGHTNLDNVSIAGVTTFTGVINANGGASVTGNITATGNLTPSGTLYLTDAIEHTDDSNTKIRFPAADTFSVETAGSTRLHIHSDGRFRVGATSQPSGTVGGFQLDMGSYPGTMRLMSGAGASATGQSAGISVGGSNHHANLSNGNNYGATLNLYNYNSTDGNSSAVSFMNSNGLSGSRVVGNNASHSSRTGNLVFMTASGSSPTEKLRITSGGNVYHTGGGNDRRYSFAGDGTAHYLSFDNTLNGIKLNGYGAIAFETNGTNERLRIDSTGRLLLGSGAIGGTKITGPGGLDVSQYGLSICMGGSAGSSGQARANSATKEARLVIPHYTNAEEPLIAIAGFSASSYNYLNYGGGTSLGNVATRHQFYTAANTTTTGGSEKLKIEHAGVRSFATFVDTSYHANPDPFGDGSGVAYYRMNYNFHDSGFFAKHGTSSDGTANTGQPHFSLVNSSGEPCWDNPNEGAITIPNLKNGYSFSMAAWINLSEWSTSSNNDVIMNTSIGGTRVTLCMCTWGGYESDGMDFYIMYGGQGHHYFRPSSRPTNEWIHVVYSVVGANNTSHRVYQNGADLTTRGDRGGGHGGSAGWRLGGNANGSERFAIGKIGSIRFFNKALSSSEASALYTNDTFYT